METLRNYMNVSILELIIIIILCYLAKDKTSIITMLLISVVILAIIQGAILCISYYRHKKNKTTDEGKEKQEKTNVEVSKEDEKLYIREDVNIKKELRKNITSELNKLNNELIKNREEVISESLSNVVKNTTNKNQKVKENELVNHVNKAVENTYKEVYTQVRNKISESNESLIGKIECQVKDYVESSPVKDEIAINIEINDMLDESMAIYNREIKQLLSRQENSLVKEIDRSINLQIRDSREILVKNNINFESLNSMIKKNTNEIIREYTSKSEAQINKLIEEANNDFGEMQNNVNYEKVNEELKKNIESIKENYMNYIQKNIDSTLDIVRELAAMEINNFKLIRKQEIKEMFNKALEKASMEIDICSYSMNKSTMFKEEIYNKLKGALKRNVKISIIYSKPEYTELKEREKATENIALMLKEDFDEYGDKFIINNKSLRETVLICDDKFAIVGEFDFLAYEGKSKEVSSNKEEMAAIITDSKLISLLRSKKFN